MTPPKRSRGRPRTEPTQQVGFRFSDELIGRLDRYVSKISEVVPGANRADAVRALLEQGLTRAGL